MKNKGFTLIEIIIYIGLFAIMIGGVLVSVFQITQNTEKNEIGSVATEEINFVKKKINYTLDEISNITSPTSGSANTFQGKKGATNITIRKNSAGNIEICAGGNCKDITSVNVKVENLNFTYLAPQGSEPEGLKIDIKLSGREASFNKYLRP